MILRSSHYDLKECHSKEFCWPAHDCVQLGGGACSESSNIGKRCLCKAAGSEHQWQKCRVYAALPDNRSLGIRVASPGQGLELLSNLAH